MLQVERQILKARQGRNNICDGARATAISPVPAMARIRQTFGIRLAAERIYTPDV
jgi:hypothetical protein